MNKFIPHAGIGIIYGIIIYKNIYIYIYIRLYNVYQSYTWFFKPKCE